MDAELNVIIKLVDQASRDVQQIKSAMKGLGDESQASSKKAVSGLNLIEKNLDVLKGAAVGFASGFVLAIGTQAAGAVKDFADASVSAASDLTESIGKTDDVFKDNSAEVKLWSETTTESFFISQQKALEAASTFGNLFTSMGITGDAASDMSMDLVELAADLGSFNNIANDEALIALRAALVGEAEPMRQLGVLMNAAAVEAKAMEMGLADSKDQLTESDKVMARYKIILDQTVTAQGNVAATGDEMAGQQKRHQAQMEDLQAAIGEGLLPAMLALTEASNEILGSEAFQAGVANVAQGIERWTRATEFAVEGAVNIGGHLNDLTGTSDSLATSVQLTATVIETSAGAFVEWVDAARDASDAISDLRTGVTDFINDVPFAEEILAKFVGGLGDESSAHAEAEDAAAGHITSLAAIIDAYAQAGIVSLKYNNEIERSADEQIKFNAAQAAIQAHIVGTNAAFEDYVYWLTMTTTAGNEFDRMTQDSLEGLVRQEDVLHSGREAMDAATRAATQLGMAQAGLAETYQLAGDNAAIFNAQGSEYSAIASDLTDAYDVLNERKKEGIQLTDEETRFLEGYEQNLGRVEGGMDDAAIQAGLYRQAQVDLMIAQDELNDAIARGEDDLGPYQAAVDGAEGSLNDAATASGGMRSANDLLVDLILTSLIPALAGINDLLTEINNNPATAKVDADTSAAYTALQGFKDYLANHPATIDLYVNQINAIGFTEKAAGGPIKGGQLALVGEEGPELIVPQGDVEVFNNPDTMRLLGLMSGFAGGFADGTQGITGISPAPGAIGINSPAPTSGGSLGTGGGLNRDAFIDVGTMIGEAINLGIELELIDSGAPTGEEYAAAIIEGATKQIDTDGDEVLDAWIVNSERIPELAAELGQDTVLGLLGQYADLQGELQLAILSGEDTGKIQAEIDAIFAIFAAWSGNTVEEVDAVWDAITDEQKAAAAKAMWDDVIDSINTPSAPVSVSVDDIISGDALADVRATFQDLWDLQRMYEEAGMPEQAAAIGEQMKALGLQEELIEAIAGTDTAQQIAEAMRIEDLGEEINARMEAVLGDDPLGIAGSIQSEIDALQEKIDYGPALGVPQEIVDQWQAEIDGLEASNDQFWADLATAFVGGGLDPQVLADLSVEQQMLLEDFLMQTYGQGAVEDLRTALDTSEAERNALFEEILSLPIEELASGDFIEQQQAKLDELYADLSLAESLGLDEKVEELQQDIQDQEAVLAAAGEAIGTPVVEAAAAALNEIPLIGEETLADLAVIFEDYPDVAESMIDDMIQAVADGRIPFEDAMELIAMAPEEDLIPALERLEEQLTVDLAEALLDPNSPDVQAFLTSLELIEDALDAAGAATGALTDEQLALQAALGNAPGEKLGGGTGTAGDGGIGGGGTGFLADGVILTEDEFGPGPYSNSLLYEQSLAQNPNSRQQPDIHIHNKVEIDGREVGNSAMRYMMSGAPAGWSVGE